MQPKVFGNRGCLLGDVPDYENGVLRIVGYPKYPNSAGSPAACAPILAGLVGLPGHVFWADAISLRQDGLVDAAQIITSEQVTDSYLLALAVSNGGKLAMLDRRLSTKAVRRGACEALFDWEWGGLGPQRRPILWRAISVRGMLNPSCFVTRPESQPAEIPQFFGPNSRRFHIPLLLLPRAIVRLANFLSSYSR